MAIAASMLLTLIVAWYLVRPHLLQHAVRPEKALSDEHRQLLDQKSRCLQVLRDLELDYATEKIAEADYQRMKADVSLELAAIFKRLATNGSGHE